MQLMYNNAANTTKRKQRVCIKIPSSLVLLSETIALIAIAIQEQIAECFDVEVGGIYAYRSALSGSHYVLHPSV